MLCPAMSNMSGLEDDSRELVKPTILVTSVEEKEETNTSDSEEKEETNTSDFSPQVESSSTDSTPQSSWWPIVLLLTFFGGCLLHQYPQEVLAVYSI